MKLQVSCDWCGKCVERQPSQLKGKSHIFCSRQCLAAFSNKSKNPNGYSNLKDYTNIRTTFTKLNVELNPTRMTPATRAKIREKRLNSGEGVSYSKYFGRHEHRIVAERILGRPLLPGEIVHHRDSNKRNNVPENIVVFPSQAAHAKHHAEMNWFLSELKKLEGGDAK